MLPKPLRTGDKVAILSPASIIRPEYVEGAAETLREAGLRPVVMPHALGRSGSFSGTAAERLSDFRSALADPQVRARLCSRGGYGCVHLLEALAADGAIAGDPRWLVGFSDVSALHALWGGFGIASVHASMAKQLSKGVADPFNAEFLGLLSDPLAFRGTAWAPHPYNRPGTAEAVAAGGNLAVVSELTETPFNVIRPGEILVVEDIAEPIYKVERILYRLKLSGVLQNLAGLVVGQFTDYRPSADYAAMEDMVRDMTAPYAYPVAFNAPFGHVDGNRPLLLNQRSRLTVGASGASLVPVFN